ncbi:hypothetical protein ACFLSQ_06380 [Bacteroidota bacterium]
MPIFALEKIEAVKGNQDFYKLFIDGNCEFDDFEEEAKVNYRSEINSVYTYMELVAKLITVSPRKFKDITPKKENVKEYEFKTKHLRIYAIKEPGGKLVICGGYKNTQPRDIRHFREVKKQYLKSKD